MRRLAGGPYPLTQMASGRRFIVLSVLVGLVPVVLATAASAATQGGKHDRQAPSTPTGLVATAVSSSEIDLSWNASTDNVGVAGYRVVRDGSQIASVSGKSYADTSLQPSTASTYTVAAFDSAGNVSGPSSPATATTQAGSAPPPTSGGADSFERSVNGSWGTGPLGAWTYEVTSGSPFQLSVDGHEGVAVSLSVVNKGNLLVGEPISGPPDV